MSRTTEGVQRISEAPVHWQLKSETTGARFAFRRSGNPETPIERPTAETEVNPFSQSCFQSRSTFQKPDDHEYQIERVSLEQHTNRLKHQIGFDQGAVQIDKQRQGLAVC